GRGTGEAPRHVGDHHIQVGCRRLQDRGFPAAGELVDIADARFHGCLPLQQYRRKAFRLGTRPFRTSWLSWRRRSASTVRGVGLRVRAPRPKLAASRTARYPNTTLNGCPGLATDASCGASACTLLPARSAPRSSGAGKGAWYAKGWRQPANNNASASHPTIVPPIRAFMSRFC